MRRSVAVFGVGAFEFAAQSLVALMVAHPVHPWDVALFDPEDERLDLMDRFARRVAQEMEAERRISATTNAEEAARDADLLLWGIDSRALTAHAGTAPADGNDDGGDGPRSIAELGRGDRNRPTPEENLPPQFRGRLERASRVLFEADREGALDALSREVPPGARVLVPVGHSLAPSREHEPIAWPEHSLPGDESAQALQIYRWIKQEEAFSDLLAAVGKSELVRSLRDFGEPGT